MRAWSVTACGVIVGGVLAAVAAAPASAETFTFSVPLTGLPVVSECTGEPIVLTKGTSHYKATSDPSDDGFKFQIESNLSGISGVGATSGARYVMQVQQSEMVHADLTNSQTTIETTTNLTRQRESSGINLLLGPGDDYRLHVITHLTVNANGVPTAEKLETRADCR